MHTSRQFLDVDKHKASTAYANAVILSARTRPTTSYKNFPASYLWDRVVKIPPTQQALWKG